MYVFLITVKSKGVGKFFHMLMIPAISGLFCMERSLDPFNFGVN